MSKLLEGKMTFTDDDLKRLKDKCKAQPFGATSFFIKDINALLARLEAAEKYIEVNVWK